MQSENDDRTVSFRRTSAFNPGEGNRIAVALHNFWNALFIPESTLAFVTLVTIIETFTNLNKGEDTAQQVYRNTLKLVPVDGHGNTVTKKRLEDMYDARSGNQRTVLTEETAAAHLTGV